jgi:cytidine deaminase
VSHIVPDAQLTARAIAARQHAYAPYSKFLVGAALLADGQIFEGANVENASYGLAICAERAAILRAVYAGMRKITVIAVATGTSPPGAPCGACLQTMREFAPDPSQLRVILVNDHDERRSYSLAELLPHGFGPEDLHK